MPDDAVGETAKSKATDKDKEGVHSAAVPTIPSMTLIYSRAVPGDSAIEMSSMDGARTALLGNDEDGLPRAG